MSPRPRPPSPRQRGGRRPGAGAPKGNLNALKHGETSRQMQHLATALALVPGTRKALLRLMAPPRRQQAPARPPPPRPHNPPPHPPPPPPPARRQSAARHISDHRPGSPPPPPPLKIT